MTVAGEFVEHHHHGGSIVVDRNCCLCSSQGADQLFAVRVPAAALHSGKIVFQRGVALCCIFDCRYCLRCEGASSQISVEYHACGIDHLLERGLGLRLQTTERSVCYFFFRGRRIAFEDHSASCFNFLANTIDYQFVGKGFHWDRPRKRGEHFVYGGKGSQGFELEFCWHSLQPLLCLIGSNPSVGSVFKRTL